MIYVDACALIKLVVDEAQSDALDIHLAKHNADETVLISSELSRVEVHRALTRLNADQDFHAEADTLLAKFATLPVRPMFECAAEYPFPHLGTLDALHLASAQSLGNALTQFITCDRQLSKFAAEISMPVVAPGA